jgi:hypothetical protein
MPATAYAQTLGATNMDSAIEKFKVKGAIYLWKYLSKQNSYPGWNLTADKVGCDSLSALMTVMDNSDYPSKKSLRTEPPIKQVKVANQTSTFETIQLLTLQSIKEEMNNWVIEEGGNELVIVFGSKKLTELKNAIHKVKDGQGDFAISDDKGENILYFWWHL